MSTTLTLTLQSSSHPFQPTIRWSGDNTSPEGLLWLKRLSGWLEQALANQELPFDLYQDGAAEIAVRVTDPADFVVTVWPAGLPATRRPYAHALVFALQARLLQYNDAAPLAAPERPC